MQGINFIAPDCFSWHGRLTWHGCLAHALQGHPAPVFVMFSTDETSVKRMDKMSMPLILFGLPFGDTNSFKTPIIKIFNFFIDIFNLNNYYPVRNTKYG